MTIALTIGGNGFSGLPGSSFSSSSSSFRLKNSRKKNTKMMNRTGVICSSSSVMDPYKTLRIRPDSSEYEVKKAFRQLAKKVLTFFFFGSIILDLMILVAKDSILVIWVS